MSPVIRYVSLELASVAGLAPARTSLKGWWLELLCIHGRKSVTPEDRNTRSHARGHALTRWTRFLRGDMDALAVELARLVSEEWPKRCNDGHESGINQVLDHCLNIFVGGGRFFVEQIALFADDAATQSSLREFADAETFAHALASITARPLATRTVCQRPRVALTVTSRLDDIAQRAARTRDHNKVAVSCDCAFAVNPHNLTVTLVTSDAVVATVPDTFGFRAELGSKPPGNKRAIRLRPTYGGIVAIEILLANKRLSSHAGSAMLSHMSAQDGFTQTARTTVDEDGELHPFGCPCV